jgi:cadmium resistance protein CadD (predicted permease)
MTDLITAIIKAIANDSDNISIYLPLFANSTLERLIITVITFLLLVAVWYLIAYKLTNISAISNLLIWAINLEQNRLSQEE